MSRQNRGRGDERRGLVVQRVGQGGQINLLFSRSGEEFMRELIRPLFGEGGRRRCLRPEGVVSLSVGNVRGAVRIGGSVR